MLTTIYDRLRAEPVITNAVGSILVAIGVLCVDAFVIVQKDVVADYPAISGLVAAVGVVLQAWRSRQKVSPV
jgi:hypothetical protein